MAHLTGSIWYGTWIWSGGTVTLSGDQRSFNDNRTIDLAESTAGSDTDKSFLPTVKDGTMDFEYVEDNAGGTTLNRALAAGNQGTITWGNMGSATGMPKFQCVAIVKDNKRTSPYADVSMHTVTLQKTGAMVLDADSLGSAW